MVLGVCKRPASASLAALAAVPGSTSKSTSVHGNAGGGGCGDASVSDSTRKTVHGTKKDKMKAMAKRMAP